MRSLLVLSLLALACDSPALVVVDNAYPAGTRVDEVWWRETLVPDVVDPGGESPAYRAAAGADFAYAVLERDGARLVVRTTAALSVERGETLHVVLAPDTVVGDCATGAPLTQAEADGITESIFPGAFAGATYDAATCKLFEPGDAGPE